MMKFDTTTAVEVTRRWTWQEMWYSSNLSQVSVSRFLSFSLILFQFLLLILSQFLTHSLSGWGSTRSVWDREWPLTCGFFCWLTKVVTKIQGQGEEELMNRMSWNRTFLWAANFIGSISTLGFSVTNPPFRNASKSIGTLESIRSTSRSIRAI